MATPHTYVITGGSGSLGAILTKRLLSEGHKVRAVARNEHGLEKLKKQIPQEHYERYSGLVGDIRDLDRMRLALYGATHVIHAAALKVVPICERDPNEAILTNVIGTTNVARAVIDTPSIQRAVFIGTDKQVESSTLYGATKLCGMRAWLASNQYTPKRKPFVGVLYGNVLASNGSILHVFRKQAESGTVSVTDFRCTRFHMRLATAADLVLDGLHKADAGDIWVPKLRTYRVVDFASVVAPDCQQKEIGLRANEKIHEVLVSQNEATYTRDVGSHFVVTPGVMQGKGGWQYHSGMEGLRMNKEEIKREIEACYADLCD